MATTHPLHLSEQVILITGASAGIGSALAQTLAKQFLGIRLILAARNKEKLETVATQCQKAGAPVLVVPTDMADTQQVQALASQGLQHFGRVDILVNNAGYGQMGPLELLTPAAAQQQMAVNFHGPLTLAQALIPHMRNQGRGKIINISSLGGRMAFPAGGLYSASKFALEAMSDVLRMELKGFNIQVSVIEPGPVITEFFTVARSKLEEIVPEPEKTIYSEALTNVAAIEKQVELLGWSAEKVAQVIIRVLQAKNPRSRYVAATGGGILIFLMTKLLPTWVSDIFWKRFYGIDKVERAWRERKENKERID